MSQTFLRTLYIHENGKVLSGHTIEEAVKTLHANYDKKATSLKDLEEYVNIDELTEISRDDKTRYSLRYLKGHDISRSDLTIYFENVLNFATQTHQAMMISIAMLSTCNYNTLEKFVSHCNHISSLIKNGYKEVPINRPLHYEIGESDEGYICLWNGYEISIIKSVVYGDICNHYVYSAFAVDTFGKKKTRYIDKLPFDELMSFLRDIELEELFE